MAKITVCTNQGEVWHTIENIKAEELEGMAWASLMIEIKDALERAIAADEK